MDEHDGALPASVKYRTFRKMYTTLHTGVQPGLSHVVTEVFSKELITPYVKSVAENLSITEHSRVSSVLDALLSRIKNKPETFDIFADVLDSIESLSYLAKGMRELWTQLAKEESDRIEEIQKQEKQQMKKRQSLQLDYLETPKRPPAPHLETLSSPTYSTVRRIHENNPVSSPVIVNQGVTPQKFTGPVSVLSTPSLGPSSLPSSAPALPPISERALSAVTRQLLTPNSSRQDLPRSTSVPVVVSTTTEARETESSGAATKSSPSAAPREPPINEEDGPLSLCLDRAPSDSGPHSDGPVEAEQQLATPPTMITTMPTPDTSLIQSIAQRPSDSDDDDASLLVALRPSTNYRTMSVESSVSTTCSEDFHSAPTSLQEDEIMPAAQESDDAHGNESLVGPKLQRSVSCEKCLLEKLREDERMIAKLQLETSQLQAAYESNIKKLLTKSNSLQSELYELKYSLHKHQVANDEWQRHCEELRLANIRLTADNRRLQQELCTVKVNAYDKMVAFEQERSKNHQCPCCNAEFYYPSCI